ncbi:MAG: histidinol-phosphate transaminase [Actinobacteria bacterium]|nr:histidinol-phosphate transaminase [Actinomycetota bacterium]
MTNPKLRSDLIGRTPYGAPQLDVEVKLNVNENPFAPSEQLINAISEAVTTAVRDLNRYPDRDAIELRKDLAQYISGESECEVSWENIWPANGSNEVMHHLLQAFGGPGRRLVTFGPTYSMYPDYCRETFTEYVEVPRKENFSIDSGLIQEALRLSPDIIVLCSPNNPSGTVLDPDLLDEIVASFPGLLIIDEAYAEFREAGQPSSLKKYAGHSTVVVTRTMSKAFSCAGLRLGYAVAHPNIVSACQLVRLPYHLSAVTQAVARAALAHSAELLGQVSLLKQERDSLLNWFIEHGFLVTPTGANFILFGKFADRDSVWKQLLSHGVLIRQSGPEGWLRVSIGTPTENEKFRKALLSIDL